MTSSDREPENNYQIYHPPIETEDKDLFRISPLALIDHVQNEPDRVLERTYKEDSVELKVKGGLTYDEDDPSQENWRFEYGSEFFIDGPKEGLVRHFVDYEPVHSSRESAQSTISNRIFTELEKRSLRDYAKKGYEEAAEILNGENT